MADVSVEVTQRLMERLRERIKDENLKEADEVKKALKDEMKQFFPKDKDGFKTTEHNTCCGCKWCRKDNIYR